MDLARIKRAVGKDKHGNSTRLRRVVRRTGSVLHHTVPSLLRRPVESGQSPVDGCLIHDGMAAPPSPHPAPPNFPVGCLDTLPSVNPILTASDVTDYGTPDYVADPFLLLEPDYWQLFFEIFNPDRDPTAVIGRATSTDNGRSWTYEGIVLDPGVHVSFPYVFKWDGSTYMLPNLDPDDGFGPVTLYKWEPSTQRFTEVATLVEPRTVPATDRVVFRWDGRWWLLVSMAGAPRELLVYHADSLTQSGWTPHEDNPVVTDEPRIPGGRPVVTEDRLLMYFQDGPSFYGEAVYPYEITALSPSEYADRPLGSDPVVAGTDTLLGWNSGRMHTFDPWFTGDRWVCAVDGDIGFGRDVFTPHWSIGLYQVPV
jgi:hypothetical protein